MSLDLTRLENVKERGARTVAACPACREVGADRKGNHLSILDDGRFNCIVNPSHEHRQRIWQLAGEDKGRFKWSSGYSARVAKPKLVCGAAPKPRAEFPPMRMPTAEELATIARVRGWPTVNGLQESLVERGMLFTGEVYDDGRAWPAWIVTDPTRRNGQARRMDGQPWEGIGGAKAKSLRGTSAERCIGASLIGEQTEAVWLMEGTPDLCAAPILARGIGLEVNKLAFVCITGTGNLHAEDLPFFTGKPVVIAVHNDAEHGAGAKAAARWIGQLKKAGAGPVTAFNFAAYACKDLSDYLAAVGNTRVQRAGREDEVEAEPTGEDVRRASGDGELPNESPNTAKTSVPSELCAKSWARGILAPIGGPTALGADYVWPEFTAEQIESDASLGGEE